ncbi:oligosaccharyl transferase glycoprotein complex, beta subunit [Ophidiomyces ophidiicola]|nr:oligosaccharyl transferase glycoprotein complex, beta subunit [Ophidiomyces ophidiicola]KAI1985252.1 oligosaccharyl transferase glycoprotein complex, beta subunit [Ophidiomyces ophidiicola]KAI1987148.1 oligosaccharyl transferase glycoprotein complex, beta subunit [Ophidiomyces ophidiicola]KAI2000701.1 oligosaccharyl transferase glycoprotein complex, beta subunit [Ophidiomyces ophidiicola]
MQWLLSLLVLGIYYGAVQALSSSGSRLLVIQEEASEKQLYSTFWADLESRGYSITFAAPKNESLSLFKHGVRSYDHLMILPTKTKGLGPALTPNTLLNFLNGDGNILLALSGGSPVPNAISSLLLELDISLSPDRAPVVVDHFNFDTLSSSDFHDTLLVAQPKQLRLDVKNLFAGHGILAFPKSAGQALGNASPLLTPIIHAPSTAYSYDTKEMDAAVEDPFATGSQISLVSAVQARNSARLTILGSLQSLEDKWFSATVKGPNDGKESKTGNREFAKRLTAWTFKETGVIKVGKVQHYLSESDATAPALTNATNPTIYRIKNKVTFNIELSEHDNDHWIPFEVPKNDQLQLEFTMLSPFHRLNLKPVSKTATGAIYGTTFVLPDQHGIFSFRVNYKRPFLTNVYEKHEITVRHFAHDEWPRSWTITGGWVWIAGLWSVIGGFLAFTMLWLYSAPPKQENGEKKEQ